MPSGRWLAEARRDSYKRKAKEEGYRSRAAYKLLEAHEKYGLMRRGSIVVELGAWPGGMSQAAARIVGPEGVVVAIDRRGFREFRERNILTLELDILEDDVVGAVLDLLEGRRADLLVSDASPRFMGVREVDVARQLELTIRSHEIARELLARGGSAMLKAFECEELRELEREMRKEFRIVKRFIPRASRKTSSELYLIGLRKIR